MKILNKAPVCPGMRIWSLSHQWEVAIIREWSAAELCQWNFRKRWAVYLRRIDYVQYSCDPVQGPFELIGERSIGSLFYYDSERTKAIK